MHVVGPKYVDYFTDGTTIFSFPGDPLIDANLNKPDAPIPTHAGLTWVSSKAMEAYDTPSGDLEPGTYAQEANGSFIANTSGFSAERTSASSRCVLATRSDARRQCAAPCSQDYGRIRLSLPRSCGSRRHRLNHLFPPGYFSNRLKHA